MEISWFSAPEGFWCAKIENIILTTQVPAAESSPSNTGTRSWNLGKYVLATPTTGVTCNSAPTPDSPNNDGYNSVRPGQSLSQCKNTVDVSDPAWKPTYESKEGTWTTPDGSGTVDTLVSVDPNTKTYDAHYLLGRWYQWNTATAGTGGTLVSPSTSEPVNAPSSICPKGWQLPSSEMNTKSLDPKYGQTFYKLFTNYGYKFDNTDGGGRIYGPNEQNGYNVATAPFYFTRSGIIVISIPVLRYMGYVSDGWTSTAQASSNNSYQLDINSAATYPSLYDHNSRWAGLTLRCLAS